MECLRGGIIRKLSGKGVGEPAGRTAFSHQKLRSGEAAFDAALPGHQHGCDLRVMDKPFRIHHAADVQHDDDLVEPFFDGRDHRLFGFGQIEVPVVEDSLRLFDHIGAFSGQLDLFALPGFAVPAFAGKTADRDHSRIRKPARAFRQLLRKRRLGQKPGFMSGFILRLDILFIIRSGFRIDLHHIILHAETLEKVPCVSHGHVSASAAAFYIIKDPLAEKSDPGPFGKGKYISFILQQHHAFLGGFF